MPATLVEFWALYNELASEGPSLTRAPLNIRLSKLFNVFADVDPGGWETIYFDDPPEWITLLDTVDMDSLHWGYFVESYPPTCLEVVSCRRSTPIFPAGNDLFEALHDHLVLLQRSLLSDLKHDRQNETYYRDGLALIEQVVNHLQPRLGATPPCNRQPAITTRDGYGIALDPGLYRPLQDDAPLLEPTFQPQAAEVARWGLAARQALDEGYPLTALKLGRDLWRYPQFLDVSHDLLKQAYTGLAQPILLARLEQKHAFRKHAGRQP
jgi:hypothetical protein